MGKKRNRERKVKCIVYLSTVGDMKHVITREHRQLNYISNYAKGNNIEIVKIMRRNILGQFDVNRHFDAMVQMVKEGFADGILIANMHYISVDIDDACRKIAKVSNAGGAIYSVDDGKLEFRYKEVPYGYKVK